MMAPRTSTHDEAARYNIHLGIVINSLSKKTYRKNELEQSVFMLESMIQFSHNHPDYSDIGKNAQKYLKQVQKIMASIKETPPLVKQKRPQKYLKKAQHILTSIKKIFAPAEQKPLETPRKIGTIDDSSLKIMLSFLDFHSLLNAKKTCKQFSAAGDTMPIREKCIPIGESKIRQMPGLSRPPQLRELNGAVKAAKRAYRYRKLQDTIINKAFKSMEDNEKEKNSLTLKLGK